MTDNEVFDYFVYHSIIFASLIAFIYNIVNLFRSRCKFITVVVVVFCILFLWLSRLGGKTDVIFQRVRVSVSLVATIYLAVIFNGAKKLICSDV